MQPNTFAHALDAHIRLSNAHSYAQAHPCDARTHPHMHAPTLAAHVSYADAPARGVVVLREPSL
jgi:hypothetical protein